MMQCGLREPHGASYHGLTAEVAELEQTADELDPLVPARKGSTAARRQPREPFRAVRIAAQQWGPGLRPDAEFSGRGPPPDPTGAGLARGARIGQRGESAACAPAALQAE